MSRPPLPAPVARRARTYLASLVPAEETSDAWHELVADATYWGECEELPVLRLAHQVVLQHQRVTPEVAALALDEMGVSSSTAVAEVLDLSRADAEALLQRIADDLAEVDRAPEVHVFDAEAGGLGAATADEEGDEPDGPSATVTDDHDEAPRGATAPPGSETDEPAGERPVPEDEGPAPDDEGPGRDASPPEASAAEPSERTRPRGRERPAGRAVRIGFEDDDVIEVDHWDQSAGMDARRWGVILLVLVVAAVLLWLLTG